MKRIALLFLACLITSCAQRAVLTDYDPNVNFKSIQSVIIAGQAHEDKPPQAQVIDLVSAYLTRHNITITDESAAEARLSVTAYIEQRPNDQTMTIGVGAGNMNRNSSISVGTSVNVPIGDDLIDWQVIQIDLIQHNQVIWTASDSAKLRIRDGKGRLDVQQKMVERLLAEFPLIASEVSDE